MRYRARIERRCSYVVVLEHDAAPRHDLRQLADYLTGLAAADVDVVVVDASAPPVIEEHRRVLRWVARYVTPRAARLDAIRIAMDVSQCEKIILAAPQVRYDDDALDDMCALLELHEVVEPQDYVDPLPWWGGIEAGRMLIHRGIGPLMDHGSTFGFRRKAVRALRSIDSTLPGDEGVRRLALQGAEVFAAAQVFVRRLPPVLGEWIRERPHHGGFDFAVPLRAAFFFSVLPLAALLISLGGVRLAGGYAGAIAAGAIALAVRGRSGAASFFPWRACLFAPLWIAERSLSVYWALLQRVTATAERSEVTLSPDGHGDAARQPHVG